MPMTNEQVAALFKRPSLTVKDSDYEHSLIILLLRSRRERTFLVFHGSKAGSHSHLEPAVATGRARVAIPRHLRLQARLEQLSRAPQRRRSKLERPMNCECQSEAERARRAAHFEGPSVDERAPSALPTVCSSFRRFCAVSPCFLRSGDPARESSETHP